MRELQTIRPDPAKSVALADLAASIRQEHAAVIIAARTTLQHALNAGELLIAAKEQIAHGYFGDWLREHCDLSERSAQKYMQLARHRAALGEANPPLAADLTMDEALRVIAKPKPPIEIDADYFVVPTSDYLPTQEGIARIGELQRHDCLQIFGVWANAKFPGFYRVALLEMYGGEDGPAMQSQPDGGREVRADIIAEWFQREMRWPEFFKNVQWRDHPANFLPFSEPRPRYGTKEWIEQSRRDEAQP